MLSTRKSRISNQESSVIAEGCTSRPATSARVLLDGWSGAQPVNSASCPSAARCLADTETDSRALFALEERKPATARL